MNYADERPVSNTQESTDILECFSLQDSLDMAALLNELTSDTMSIDSPSPVNTPQNRSIRENKSDELKKPSGDVAVIRKSLPRKRKSSSKDNKENVLFVLKIPRVDLSIKDCGRLWLTSLNEFNRGDLDAMFATMSSFFATECLFRMNHIQIPISYAGNSLQDIMLFSKKMLSKYPDMIAMARKVSSVDENGETVIKSSVHFSGTMIVINSHICGTHIPYSADVDVRRPSLPVYIARCCDDGNGYVRAYGNISYTLHLNSRNRVIRTDASCSDITFQAVDKMFVEGVEAIADLDPPMSPTEIPMLSS